MLEADNDILNKTLKYSHKLVKAFLKIYSNFKTFLKFYLNSLKVLIFSSFKIFTI